MARSDLVGIVEAAYDLQGNDESWLKRVAEASKPHFDRGKGGYAFEFDADDPSSMQVSRPVVLGEPCLDPAVFQTWHTYLTPEMVKTIYWRRGPMSTLGQRMAPLMNDERARAMWQMCCVRPGIRDHLSVQTSDLGNRGIAVAQPTGAEESITRQELALWGKITAHMAAGYRLRQRIARGALDSATLAGAEAVLKADGSCEHADGKARSASAREILRDAAKRVDRARGKLRRQDPHEAIEIWQGLVAGTWSLVDHFDSDGRRYLVARRNCPRTRDPRALTPRESQAIGYAARGHSNKDIAYTLGLSVSTVGAYIASAMRKLGVKSRVKLSEIVLGITEAPASLP